MTDKKTQQLEFWTGFKSYVLENGWKLRLENLTPQPRYYMDIRFGISGIHLSLHLKDQLVLTGLYINVENKDAFHKLYRHRQEIEKILGQIKWIESTPKNVSRLIQYTTIDWTDEKHWKLAYNWLMIRTYTFQEVTKMYLK